MSVVAHAFAADVLAQANQFGEGAENDLDVGPGLPAGDAGVVVDADFGDAQSLVFGAGEKLGADEGALAAQLDLVDERLGEELEGAVDVADFEAEEGADEDTPAEGVGPADERVGALDSITDGEVAAIEEIDELVHFGQVELAVAVGEEDPGIARFAQTAGHCAAVAEVGIVVDGADAGIGLGERFGDFAGAILAPVVDEDDFEFFGETGGGFDGGARDAFDVGFFVIAGKKDGKFGKLLHQMLIETSTLHAVDEGLRPVDYWELRMPPAIVLSDRRQELPQNRLEQKGPIAYTGCVQ